MNDNTNRSVGIGTGYCDCGDETYLEALDLNEARCVSCAFDCDKEATVTKDPGPSVIREPNGVITIFVESATILWAKIDPRAQSLTLQHHDADGKFSTSTFPLRTSA